jgi:DNA-binding cell septation regulator SpoVG
MKITEINIELIKPNNGMIGFASLVIDNNIYLSSIAIHKKLNAEGYRLTYPSKGTFTLFHPINRQTSETIEQEIFIKLKDVLSKNVCQRNMMQE